MFLVVTISNFFTDTIRAYTVTKLSHRLCKKANHMFQQVSADGARTECQADIAELKHLLKETRENFQERIAGLERNEMKLYERIATN